MRGGGSPGVGDLSHSNQGVGSRRRRGGGGLMEWMTATLKENSAMRVWEEVSQAFQKAGVQGMVSALSLPSFTLWHCSPAGVQE